MRYTKVREKVQGSAAHYIMNDYSYHSSVTAMKFSGAYLGDTKKLFQVDKL